MSTATAHHVHQHLRGEANAAKPAENSTPANAEAGHEDRFCLIQVQAYGLWEQAGKPNDDESRERYWHEAEKAITTALHSQ